MSLRPLRFAVPVLPGGLALVLAIGGLKFAGPHSVFLEGAQVNAAPPARAAAKAGEPPVPAPPSSAELRKRFPIVSVGKRLDYEARLPAVADRPEPKLAELSRKRLDDLEQHYSQKNFSAVRSESLRLLHSAQVDKFMKSEGFGMSRMLKLEPSPQHLEYREPEAIPLAATSADDFIEQPVATVVLPERAVLEEASGAWTPSQEMLTSFHFQDKQNFAGPWSLGWVKDREHVAGFVAHGFGYLPELMHPENQIGPPAGGVPHETRPARWKVGRLELVSLLKFDEPAVYVSEALPRMKDLATAKTRALTDFEREALSALEAGEDLVTAPSTNDIYLLGAVRALKQCTECHAARRGELLGAFSYRLKRSPPLKVRARGDKPAA
jgi:hypothetical protein